MLELRSAREKIALYEDYIAKEKEQDAREKANYDRSLELEKQATALAQEQAKFYQQLYEVATKKKGGVKHTLCKIFTLGLARCG